MNRPKLRFKLKPVDYIFEVVGYLGLVILIAVPAFYFNVLPDRLPSHYNALGQPDSYNGRGAIWVLPVTGLVLFIGMTILNNFPWLFNYPKEVTEENAKRLYSLAQRTIRLLKLIIIFSFIYLNYKTIMIGLNKSIGLGRLYLPIFLTICFLLTGVMISKATKK